jgi:pimeloyl-ACP methyl ester carboxylesterase
MSGEDAAQVYLNQLNATLERRDLSDEVGKIKCPLTVIGGKEDKVVSKESILRVKDHNPNAVVHIIEDCGHFVPLEKPEELNAILSSF